MKKIVLVLMAAAMTLLTGNKVSAQGKYGADSAECIKYLSYYQEYFKQKNYDSALPNWRKAYSLCPPTANQNMLIHGTTLLKGEIKKASDKARIDGIVDSILVLYEQRAANFPKNKVTALNNKGIDLVNYRKDRPTELFDGLNDIISRNGSETRASILMFDLQTAIELYQAGSLDAESVIKIYQDNIALLEGASSTKNDAEKEQDAKVKSDMEGLFITSKVASCENLIALFTPRYEANPDDIDLVTSIVAMMSTAEDCTDNDLYMAAATSMYKLQPTAKSAYYLYRLNAGRNNAADAIKYLEEAISYPDLDVTTSADYNYQLATYCVKNGYYSKAYSAAKAAMDKDETYTGKCYYLMGTIWASQSCSGDEITARSKYWVATDYMQKAKAADSTLADDCNSMISAYRVYFPQTADAFMYDLTDGQSYTASCGGLSAQTTVRTQK